MKRVMLDMDGVLCDFVAAICRHHGVDIPPQLDFLNVEKALGLNKEAFWKGVNVDFWAHLPWMPDGQAIFNEVTYRFPDVRILTCLPKFMGARSAAALGKMAWVNMHLPSYMVDRLILCVGDKSFAARKNTLLIDDYSENTVNFERAGGSAILVPRPWNYLKGRNAVEYVTKELRAYKPKSFAA